MPRNNEQAPARAGDADAETIGIKALEFVAADPAQFRRFLDLTGLDVGELRAASREPSFFAGLLDFLLGHEPTLLAFAAESGIPPERVHTARETLGDSFRAAPR